jgi:ABC-type protease/lipase transport system fused ATPase/permease subunit
MDVYNGLLEQAELFRLSTTVGQALTLLVKITPFASGNLVRLFFACPFLFDIFCLIFFVRHFLFDLFSTVLFNNRNQTGKLDLYF